MVIFVDFSQGFLHLRRLRKSLPDLGTKISTSWSQTPDEGIGTLRGKCGTQEVAI